MIPRLRFVVFSFFSSTSYVVSVVLYNAKKVSNSNMQSKVKIKTPKEEWKLKIYTFFIFELENSRTLIL